MCVHHRDRPGGVSADLPDFLRDLLMTSRQPSVCNGNHTTYCRNTEHQGLFHIAVAPGEHGSCRRRHQCIERSGQCAGRNRPGRTLTLLPGYLKVPTPAQSTLALYNAANYNIAQKVQPTVSYTVRGAASVNPPSLHWWKNGTKYIASMLKAWWPTVTDHHTHIPISPGRQQITPSSRCSMQCTMTRSRAPYLTVKIRL